MPPEPTPPDVSRRLLAVLLLGLVGAGTELVLIEHFEDFDQRIPLITLGLGILALVLHAVSRRGSLRALFGLAMIGLAASGAYGTYLHYLSNAEFQLELHPELSGWSLFLAAMRAHSPPSLAPGALTLLALFGLIAASARRPAPTS